MIRQWNTPAVWLLGGFVIIIFIGALYLASSSIMGFNDTGDTGSAASISDSARIDSIAGSKPQLVEPQVKKPPAESEAAGTAAVESTETEGKAAAPEDVVKVPESNAFPSAEVLSGDTRSDQLRRLTATWKTDWERRTIEYDEILSGGPPRDGIPSIDNPKFVGSVEASAWLADNEPVIALELNGDARAYPLQVLTWHEIANDTVGGIPVIVTFCPLCNSALVFDRRVGDEVYEFGVSGLLRNSDLIMYDRTTESLWQQFTGEGIVGDHAGNQLTFLASSLVSFADFQAAFPEGQVLSRETGFSRAYGRNPYEGYDTAGSNPFLFRGSIDGRLSAVERVVTVSLAEEAVNIAYPLSTLSEVGVINDLQNGRDLVVFHTPGTSSALGRGVIADAEDVGATGVFSPIVNGSKLIFQKQGDRFVDDETGSTWNILGQAIEGELIGESLAPVVHGDHFWFSWAAFRPDTIIYE